MNPTQEAQNKEFLAAAYKADTAAGRPADAATYGLAPSEVSVVSTDQGNKVLNGHVADHSMEMAALKSANDPRNAVEGQLKDSNGNTLTKVFNTQTGEQKYINPGETPGNNWLTADEASATGIKVPQVNTAIDAQRVALEADEREINNAFDTQSVLMDASNAGLIKSIKSIYDDRITEQKSFNARSVQSSARILGGLGRYAPNSVKGVLNMAEKAGLDKIKTIANEESGLLAQADQALQDKKYQLFVAKRSELTAKRKDRQTETQKLLDEATKIQKEQRDRVIQSSRDSAIANLMGQGITDPKQILNYLNHDDRGKPTGDFTAKDVADFVKSVSPDGNVKNLSTDAKEFFTLKDLGGKALPASITSLPEGEQLMAYIKMKSDAARKAASTTPTTPVGNKLTLNEASKIGLPVELVGMSEKEILTSLNNSEPPQWFLDVLISKAGGNPSAVASPGVIFSLWDQFRQEINGKLTPAPKAATDPVSKATSYFKDTYGDSITEEQAGQLADRVQTYVNGGLTYAKAVQKVVSEASQ